MAEVAHEVGTPLHSVAGHLELLRKDLPPGLRPRHRAAVGRSSTPRCPRHRDHRRLLDATRRVPGEPARWTSGADSRHGRARPAGPRRRPAHPRRRARAQRAGVPGQHDQLQQVILNLLTNAIAATPPDGAITMTTRARRDEGKSRSPCRHRPRDPAGRTASTSSSRSFPRRRPGRGTGLGLFIRAEIVREHKGRIEIDSDGGRGQHFRVDPARRAETPGDRRLAGGPGRGRRPGRARAAR